MRPYGDGISDDELLALILRGELLLRSGGVEPDVVKWHGGWRRYATLSPSFHPISGRARYTVRRVVAGELRQRLVYRNKLVWMLEHRRLKAGGCDIDHRNGDPTDDSPGNLLERGEHENRSDNYSKQAIAECYAYFDEIASWYCTV